MYIATNLGTGSVLSVLELTLQASTISLLSHVYGVTNWLLTLTGYGNTRLSPQRREFPGHTAGSQQAYRCRSLALFWQLLYPSLLYFFGIR